MKKILYSGCVLAIVGLLSACNDYLKEDSGDLLIPGKIEEYSPMLYAEGYPSSFNDNFIDSLKLSCPAIKDSYIIGKITINVIIIEPKFKSW